MIKKLYAVDENLQPVPGASFAFAKAGVNLETYEGGAGGVLSLDTDWHPELFTSGVHVTVTAPGYEAAGVDTDIIPDGWQFIMPKTQSLLPVLGLGAIIAIGGAALYKKSNKKKVSGFDFKKDALPYVLPAGIIIAGLVVYNKIFGSSAQDEQRDAALETDIAAAGTPTMSASEISAAANAIKEDLGYSWVSNDFDDAARQLSKPRNTADVLRLVQAYGKHIITTFGIPRGSFTLEETVSSQLPADYIRIVNQYYQAQGINFQF